MINFNAKRELERSREEDYVLVKFSEAECHNETMENSGEETSKRYLIKLRRNAHRFKRRDAAQHGRDEARQDGNVTKHASLVQVSFRTFWF